MDREEFIDISQIRADLGEEGESEAEAYSMQTALMTQPTNDYLLDSIRKKLSGLQPIFIDRNYNTRTELYPSFLAGYMGVMITYDLGLTIWIPDNCPNIIINKTVIKLAKDFGKITYETTSFFENQCNTIPETSPYMRLGTTQTRMIKFKGDVNILCHHRYKNFIAPDLDKSIRKMEFTTSDDGQPELTYYISVVKGDDPNKVDLTMKDARSFLSAEEQRQIFFELRSQLNMAHREQIAYESINEYSIINKNGVWTFLEDTGMKFLTNNQREMEKFQQWKEKNLVEITIFMLEMKTHDISNVG